MAAWAGLQTWSAGSVLTAALLAGKINANLEYLLTPNYFNVVETTTTYASAVTSLVNVSATTTKSITTYGGYLRIHFQCIAYEAALGLITFALNLDGTQIELVKTNNGVNWHAGLVQFDYLWQPAAGAHSVALQWKVGSGTGNIKTDYAPLLFWAVEG